MGERRREVNFPSAPSITGTLNMQEDALDVSKAYRKVHNICAATAACTTADTVYHNTHCKIKNQVRTGLFNLEDTTYMNQNVVGYFDRLFRKPRKEKESEESGGDGRGKETPLRTKKSKIARNPIFR